MTDRITAKEIAFDDLSGELDGTRRLLALVPDGELAWKPHEKSFSLGELATHLVNLLQWYELILTQPGYDLAAAPPPRNVLPGREAMLSEFDGRRKVVESALAEWSEAGLREDWTLSMGDHVIMTLPRSLALRRLGVSHTVHHRAQLGVYLRLLGVPIPGLYGPSADES
jgi:uncharacterized damage-inducible protein DinB